MIGTKLEQYEITAHLGSGGMGKVYQAVDSRLGRNVAIKILPDLFARDAERVARFEREARVLASLNHPYIAALYGLERTATHTFLVMELVPGETLAEWIARTRKQPAAYLGEALSIARQIAQGLDAAHQTGVVHRDLKPANIKVSPDGGVKILDFGLAKVSTPRESGVDFSQSPTITNLSAMTEAGVILGTAAYMSPEQAKGHTVDKRSDIWAFGCILYEMLTGQRLFEAPDVTDTLAAVLMRDPDWSRLPAALPPSVLQLLRRCLERDRAKRMTDVAGVIFALDEALVAGTSQAPRRRRFAATGRAAGVLLTIVLAATSAYFLGRTSVEPPTIHLQVATPPGNPYIFALSPDGHSMIFNASIEGKNRLWLRRFDSGEDRPLEGTDGASTIFWSPDSRSVAFHAEGWLKRFDLASGYVRKIIAVPGSERRGSWNSTGTIIYSTSTSALFKVSAEGSAPSEQITTLIPGQSSHRYALFLPDGRRFLFQALGESQVRGLYLGSLDSKDTTRLMEGEHAFAFLAPDYLILAREGALWAQRLDMKSGKLVGSLIPVASQIWVDAQINGLMALSTSASGSLAYRSVPETRQFVWLDREGRQTGVLGEPDQSQVLVNAFARDGRSIALRRTVGGNTDVWMMDTARGAMRRATTSPAIDGGAAVAASGSRIFYSSDPKGTLWDIYEKDVDGGVENLVVTNPDNDYVFDVSPDERHLLFSGPLGDAEPDIWALPLFGDRKSFPIVKSPAFEGFGRFSPNGKWILFASNESGRSEIYAQPFPGPGPRVLVSDGRMFETGLTWTTSGEAIYVSASGKVTAVDLSERGSTLVAGPPRVLFTAQPTDRYWPTPDGQRFLVSRVVANPPPISIILNWKPPR